MAAVKIPKRCAVSVKLNTGTDSSGKAITRGLSLGKVTTSPDPDEVLGIVNVLSPCLKHAVTSVEQTRVDLIEEA